MKYISILSPFLQSEFGLQFGCDAGDLAEIKLKWINLMNKSNQLASHYLRSRLHLTLVPLARY